MLETNPSPVFTFSPERKKEARGWHIGVSMVISKFSYIFYILNVTVFHPHSLLFERQEERTLFLFLSEAH